jgi:acyl-CoA reductase-like NAD-dependent aldehyde dehydrogenase
MAARSGETEEVRSPYDRSVVGEVPTAGLDDVELALQAAERGAATWRRTPAHERMRILLRAAELADERTAQIAATISAENGKTITEATTEAGRRGAPAGRDPRRGPHRRAGDGQARTFHRHPPGRSGSPEPTTRRGVRRAAQPGWRCTPAAC